MRLFLTGIVLAMKLAIATPMIYTFSGNIGGVGSDIIDDRNQSGLFYSNGIRYNSEIEYKVLIDFDRNGEFKNLSDGTIQEVDRSGYPQYQFFYAAYVSGSPFTDLFHGRYYVPGDSVASYTPPRLTTGVSAGLNDLNNPSSRLFMYVDEWTTFSIRSNNEFAQDWKVGDVFSSIESVQNPEAMEYGAGLDLDLYLKDISPAAVPEVNDLVSFLIGIMFLAMNRNNVIPKKYQKTKNTTIKHGATAV